MKKICTAQLLSFDKKYFIYGILIANIETKAMCHMTIYNIEGWWDFEDIENGIENI
jgi:hypothetical protein